MQGARGRAGEYAEVRELAGRKRGGEGEAGRWIRMKGVRRRVSKPKGEYRSGFRARGVRAGADGSVASERQPSGGSVAIG